MLHTLVSQQLTLPMMPENQQTQIESDISTSEKSVSNNLERSMDSSKMLDYSTCDASVGQDTSLSLNGQSESTLNNMNVHQCDVLIMEAGQPKTMQHGSGHMDSSMPQKRKATTELLPDTQGPPKLSAPNRRGTHVSSSPKGSTSNLVRSSASGRKVVQAEPVKTRCQSAGLKRNTQPALPSKPLTESSESVRVKLQESLAAALALVCQQPKASSDVNTKVENTLAAFSQKELGEDKYLGHAMISRETDCLESAKSVEACTYNLPIDVDDISGGFHSKGTSEESIETWNFVNSDFKSSSGLSGEDLSFSNNFFQDELLQGNGLSWASDFNPHVSELHLKQVGDSEQSDNLQKEGASNDKKHGIQSPEYVAFQIESELFKLFRGVNKKYKEKGRSLIFNLKDRNNPELRERVMSGEILPDRLCSMTAEELASKELSQWRIAKAEELDHMKVLPDSEVNMRRLVKKTHKGEYQVDLDPDVGAAEEIPIGNSVPRVNQSKVNVSESGLPKPKKTKTVQSDQCEITIPSDGADLQGLMVDDVRDLPPIISFDEFMESLDREPPFEDLPGGTRHESNEEKSELSSESMSFEKPPNHLVDVGSENSESMVDLVGITSEKTSVHPSKLPMEILTERNKSVTPVHPSNAPVGITSEKSGGPSPECVEQDIDVRSIDIKKGLTINTVVHPQKWEHVWEGLLQLNISSFARFVALYISGEKACTREWPGCFDIKGRVKIDAFDNFVQALPVSRSRTVMMTHFVLKGGSTESERASLQEVVDSYIIDQRLGFAEPAPGVELYLCPPCSKSVDIIINHLNKGLTEKLNNIDAGLIGLLVWRKVPITPPSISPNFSSQHHKDIITKFQVQKVENNIKRTENISFRNVPPPLVVGLSQPTSDAGDDDDAPPPGFGPPGDHDDDDDLPEFNFSGGSHQSVLHPQKQVLDSSIHKVEKMRELIQKYGQNGNTRGAGAAIPTQPWNDDDDDDIPEWQPQLPQPSQNLALPRHIINQPPPPPPLQRPSVPAVWPVAQQMQPLQRPMSGHHQGSWLPYPSGNNSAHWRPNASNNRGY